MHIHLPSIAQEKTDFLWFTQLSLHFKRFISLSFALFSTYFFSQTVTLTSGTSWTVPCGITQIKVQVWGAGGGGGFRSSNQGGTGVAGGGGGGAYAEKIISVFPGDQINYAIGTGGSGSSDGSVIKNGGNTWFGTNTTLLAVGGTGVPNNMKTGGTGGSNTNSIGNNTVSGGNGTDGATNGGNGGNVGNGAFPNTGVGGTGGTVTNSNGNPGKIFGGGGGGGKRSSGSVNGGNGAAGGIIITYLPYVPPTILSADGSTTIGCGKNTVELSAGNQGTAFSTLFYEKLGGAACPAFAYINEFANAPTVSFATVDNLLNGYRTFTSMKYTPIPNGQPANYSDPQITGLENIFPAQMDAAKFKYLTIRYRVTSTPLSDNSFEIYFKKGNLPLAEDKSVRQPIISDNKWHILSIDMSTNTNWSGTDIKGLRFDFANKHLTKMDIDYLLLGDTPFLENTNDDDTKITVTANQASTTYGTLRIAECNATAMACSTQTATITNLDRTYLTNGGDWNTPSTWLPGIVPTQDNCVKIPANTFVNVNVPNAAAKNITVEDNGKLTINKDQALTVSDVIVNNGNMMIKSDGSLLQTNATTAAYTGTGTFTAERDVTNLRNNPGTAVDYVYWSSPVSNQNLQTFSPGTPATNILQYNEATDYFVRSYDGVFQPGKGYAIRAEGNQGTAPYTAPYNKTYQFVGKPNNGDISFPLKRSPNSNGNIHGYNLIGNPYPSNIDFEVLYEANKALIHNTAWFWKNNSYTASQQGQGYAGNNYITYNATGGSTPNDAGIIKAGQGFLVQSKGAEGSLVNLNFKNTHNGMDMRVAGGGSFYQKNTLVKNRFWLKLIAPNDEVNMQLIGYVEGATDAFEMDYDAQAFGLSSNLFYSLLDDKRLIIQGKANQFSEEDRINLGANFFKNTDYTIALEQAEGIFAGAQNIYLKDKKTGIITNLSQGSYTFAADKGENTGRFEIVYKPESILATEEPGQEKILIYKDGNDFVLKAQTKKITALEVFDTAGRLILQLNPNTLKVQIPADKMLNGVYILKIDQNGNITTKKIIR